MNSNLFRDLPNRLTEELVETLAENQRIRVQRIVSTGQSSPAGFWYDQDEHEWIVVLQGEAKLLFEGESQPVHLRPGDFTNIQAHRRHRVEWTAPQTPTVWLAVFYSDQ